MQYFRVTELVENIDKLNKIIELHQNTTKDVSIIKQYAYKKRESILELRNIFLQLNLDVVELESNNSEGDDVLNVSEYFMALNKVMYKSSIKSQVINEPKVEYKK